MKKDSMKLFKGLKNPVNLLIMLGSSLIFFDINYYAMANLPGSRDLACVMGAGLHFWNIIFSIAISLMLGFLVSGMIDLYRQKSSKVVTGSISGIGLIFGTLTVFCTACTIPVISIFGAAISLSFFTDYEIWFKIASLILMSYGLYRLNKQLIGECEVCKVTVDK